MLKEISLRLDHHESVARIALADRVADGNFCLRDLLFKIHYSSLR